jgi:hypothetical protein
MTSEIKKPPYCSIEEFTGKRYGYLVVIRRLDKQKWLVRCDCGKEKSMYRCALLKGNTKSCGCYKKEGCKIWNRRHGACAGGKNSPEFRVWSSVKNRVLSQKSAIFHNYGGRGIKICDRWKDSFENFLEDMGYRPNLSYTLDRIDNNGDYEPGNCRWATYKEQGRNRRTNMRITHNGETLASAEWAERLGIKAATIRARIRRGLSTQEAFTPVGCN